MIPIGVYKRTTDELVLIPGESPSDGKDDRNSRKPYVWLSPPKSLKLSLHDELFVLCDINPKYDPNE